MEDEMEADNDQAIVAEKKKKLICPLLTIGENSWYECIGERCAWYNPAGECVMHTLARQMKGDDEVL